MKKLLIFGCLLMLVLQAKAQQPNDCVNAVTVCGNGNFQSNANGIGNVQEVSGCGGFEHNSLWLKVNIVQSGTLGFDLIPSDTNILVDYDFWVYGPNRVCSNLGNPIRCATTNPNEAGLTNNHTGINGSTTLTQTGPGPNGNGYVYWLNVVAGQSYYIAIDRPEGDGGFQIQWTGTATQGAGAFPTPPEANQINDLIQCSSTPNVSVFDLNSVKSSINPDLTNNTVDFYTSLADAVDGVNPLPGIYANTSNPQTIYAKVKASGTDCYSLTEFQLNVTSVPTASVSASASAVCSGDSATFTISGTPGATVNYTINTSGTQPIVLDAAGQATITEAITADVTLTLENAQVVNGSNQVICSQNLNDSATVVVNSTAVPTITTNTPICEGASGVLQFSGGQPNATVTYSIAGSGTSNFNLDAAGDYTLTFPALTSTTTVTIESITNAVSPFCEQAIGTSETITVNPLPTIVPPLPLVECNDGTNPNSAQFDLDGQSAAISNNDPNVTVTYYETSAEANTGIPADALSSPYDSTSANQTIYVRLETNLGCVGFTTLELQVTDGPAVNVPLPLTDCDASNQGFANFDLTQAAADITSGSTQAVYLSYHDSLSAANIGTPAITNTTNYQNTTAYNQTIYVRVASQTSDCYSVVNLDLEVYDTPTIVSLPDYEECDDNQDGLAVFDFTTLYPIIWGTQDPPIHDIRFYTSESDANQPTAFIPNPTNYQNTTPGSQTIWVRLQHTITGCFAISTFEIIAATPLALDNNYTASVCDTDGDGQYTFNLLDYNPTLLANADNPSDFQVAYYPSLQNALDDAGVITNSTSYTSQANPQTVLGVRVTHSASLCYTTTSLTLDITVLPDPSQITVGPLSACDEMTPNDDAEVFNLTQVEATIGAGLSNLSYSYHSTQAQAEAGSNPITTPNNHTSGTATVFIRVYSSTANNPDCYAIFPLELEVNPLPTIHQATIAVCSPNPSGFYSFDLVAEMPSILGSSQDINDFSVLFYEDAATINQITTNPYNNTTAFNQTIYVAIVHNATGCLDLFPYELNVESEATATMPNPVSICDTDGTNDGYHHFDLTSLDDEVMNGQNAADFSVSYHLNSQDASNGDNAISNPESFENTLADSQTIYIRVSNNNIPADCFATTSVQLNIYPVLTPQISAVNGLNTLCVDYETDVLQNDVILVSDLQSANYDYTWYLNGVEIVGANQATYTVNTVAPGMYTVEVTEIQSVSGCTSNISEPFEVIQSGQAVFVEVIQSNAFNSPQTITVVVEGFGDYWFQLDNGEILDNGGVFTNVGGGLHDVYVYDYKTNTPSCGSIVIENIRVIDYPKFLTPNDDGYHDTWNIFALSDQPKASITIYNRYGKILTNLKTNGPGWDGTYEGQKLPSTDYWFELTYEEFGQQKVFRSHFALRQ